MRSSGQMYGLGSCYEDNDLVVLPQLLHSSDKPDNTVLGYLVKVKQRPGQINSELARQLGVTQDAYRLIHLGLPVYVGARRIDPNQLLGPPTAPYMLYIAHVPLREHISHFLDTVPSISGRQLRAIVLVTHFDVLHDPRMSSYLSNLSGHLQVILVASRIPLLDKPNPNIVVLDVSDHFDISMEKTVHRKHSARTSQLLIPSDSPSTTITALRDACGCKQAFDILTLGTGSAIPSVARNVSGTLLSRIGQTFFMFDCGEGTLSRLNTTIGRDQIHLLQFIFISHAHTDHYFGLVSILIERSRVSNEPLYLLCPLQIKQWLQNQFRAFNIPEIPNLRILVNEKLATDQIDHETQRQLLEMKQLLNLDSLDFCRALHVRSSFSTCLRFQSGFRFTYSGDTMPNPQLTRIGQFSDVLVHEATYDDTREDIARQKRHSTLSQASQLADYMNAKNLILTHIIDRPENHLDEERVVHADPHKRVFIAYDGMHVQWRERDTRLPNNTYTKVLA